MNIYPISSSGPDALIKHCKQVRKLKKSPKAAAGIYRRFKKVLTSALGKGWIKL